MLAPRSEREMTGLCATIRQDLAGIRPHSTGAMADSQSILVFVETITRAFMIKPNIFQASVTPEKLWAQHREASLNWLALGLLLAAWNSSSDDVRKTLRRPDSLRGYVYVSVRAAQRTAMTNQ